ncbi:MAG: biotin--[acetyl-CoA-carboxylase] ligase, partial [Woeseia sp.]
KVPDNLACLTLAAGVATLQALERGGARQLGLKWPNDICARGAKLGGILVDAQTGSGGNISVICGIGVNVDLSLIDAERDGLTNLDYSVTDLKSHCNKLPQRNVTAAAIIDRVIRAIGIFETTGLAPFRADWNRYDCLSGKRVDINTPGDEFDGVADGIDANGALRVITDHGPRRVYTGTVREMRAEHS